MIKIDALDRKILNIIIHNARTPFIEIAEACGVSRAAVHQRVQRLIEAKLITGSGYHIDYRSLGYSTVAYIGIKLEKGDLFKEASLRLRDIPEIVECHYTTGPFTMIAKLVCRDNSHLMEVLSMLVQEIPGVISTETMISLSEYLSRPLTLEVGE